jgi:hypothetical protein
MTIAEVLKEHDCVLVDMPWPMAMAAAVVTGVSLAVTVQAGNRLLALAKKATAKGLRWAARELDPEPRPVATNGYVYPVPEGEA